jgi:hypothetical protein
MLLLLAGLAQPARAVVTNGSAVRIGSVLRLTPAVPDQAGSAWESSKQTVETGFETTFQFRITEPGGIEDDPLGADGLAFVVQNYSVTALGAAGGGIGYDGIPNSLAVEFDTWPNFDLGDPDNNHVSIQTRGTAPNSVAHQFSLGSTSAIPNLSDGQVHTATIRYTPGTLQVSVDGSEVLSVAVNLAELLTLDGGRAFVGFTAGTGAAWENHDILSWSFVNVSSGPTGAELFVSAVNGTPTSGQPDQIEIGVGDCVTLTFRVRFRGFDFLDVTQSPNTTYFTDPPRGEFQSKNVWCPRPEDRDKILTLYGRHFSPLAGQSVTDAVRVKVRR